MKTLKRFITLVGISLFTALPLAAQGLFSPVATINESIVTQYELEQRIRFRTVIGLPGDAEKLSLEELIEERLQQGAADRLGLTLSEDQLQAAMEEFASRAELDVETFVKELAKVDVSAETFRDFIGAQLLWRDVVQGLFGPRAQVSESEIDRALLLTASGGIQVLLTELILSNTPEDAEKAFALAGEIEKITTQEDFEAAARQVSVAPTRTDSGRLDWLDISKLPPDLRPVILTLKTGEITDPVPMRNALAFFMMRGIRETGARAVKESAVEYATYLIPGGRSAEALSQAAQLRLKVDTCDDLYGANFGQDDARLDVTSQDLTQIPRDIALELAKLDDGEISTSLTRNNGQTLMLLMLCGRTPAISADLTRDDIRRNLINQRIVSYAEGHLAQLRADATITVK